MKLELYRHNWGYPGAIEGDLDALIAKGYGGIEIAHGDLAAHPTLNERRTAKGLKLILQVFTEGTSPEDHLTSFRRQLEAAQKDQPTMVNCHGGRDAWTREECVTFYREAVRIEKDLGIDVAHETHRGRAFFNPWITRDVLTAAPEVQLCVDLSHWVCVCERMLTTEEDIIRLVADRCLHLHARVGYEQGPQVPDPRAPEYARHLKDHEAWWDIVWASQRARGLATSSLTPEFGPPDYLHTLPFTYAPVTDLAAVCDWMAARQAERFGR